MKVFWISFASQGILQHLSTHKLMSLTCYLPFLPNTHYVIIIMCEKETVHCPATIRYCISHLLCQGFTIVSLFCLVTNTGKQIMLAVWSWPACMPLITNVDCGGPLLGIISIAAICLSAGLFICFFLYSASSGFHLHTPSSLCIVHKRSSALSLCLLCIPHSHGETTPSVLVHRKNIIPHSSEDVLSTRGLVLGIFWKTWKSHCAF